MEFHTVPQNSVFATEFHGAMETTIGHVMLQNSLSIRLNLLHSRHTHSIEINVCSCDSGPFDTLMLR